MRDRINQQPIALSCHAQQELCNPLKCTIRGQIDLRIRAAGMRITIWQNISKICRSVANCVTTSSAPVLGVVVASHGFSSLQTGPMLPQSKL